MVKGGSAKVQIGAELLCKGGKVESEYRVRRTEDRVKRGAGEREDGKRPESSLNYLTAKH